MTNSKRIEGAEIAIEDVKIGDRVRGVVRESYYGLERVTQLSGFVGKVSDQSVLSSTGRRIFVKEDNVDSTLYLETAIETDATSTRLDALPVNAIIKFTNTKGEFCVAVKGESDWGIVVDGADWHSATVYFREMLRESGDIFEVVDS